MLDVRDQTWHSFGGKLRSAVGPCQPWLWNDTQKASTLKSCSENKRFKACSEEERSGATYSRIQRAASPSHYSRFPRLITGEFAQTEMAGLPSEGKTCYRRGSFRFWHCDWVECLLSSV